MAKCLKEHDDCGNNAEQPLPTRVLYIGTTESPVLRLHEPSGERSNYICLSYCWGDPSKTSPFLQTTVATIGSLKTNIPWSELPKLFQGTVCFARKVGIKYVWIDSLCIIQDDGEDKAREIGQMAQVYSNALLTIAATSASGPHDGLFSTTSKSKPYIAQKISEVVWDFDTSDHGPLYARERIPHTWGGLDEFPLLRRAWAFQVSSQRVSVPITSTHCITGTVPIPSGLALHERGAHMGMHVSSGARV